jgi:carbonic anhydrase
VLARRECRTKPNQEAIVDQLSHLRENNRQWAEGVRARDPQFFENLCSQQAPDYLWIGCSDSRVPANTIVGLAPGEVFVHRNVANLIKQADMNCMSAMQFAVDVLKVKHIIVCGHYGCSAIVATLSRARLGLCDNWLGQVRALARKHAKLLDAAPDDAARSDLLCRLNVIEQVNNACESTVVRDAWDRDQDLTVHGWIYKLQDGLLQDLGMSVRRGQSLADWYQRALVRVAQ